MKAIPMNRNLRAAQRAAHLQKGAMKVIRMNQNLRAAQNAAHLKRKREFNAIIEILK
jgi:hypothetical protein